jgi:signal transduction histidine kinase
MATDPRPETGLPRAPWTGLRESLLAHADEREHAGDQVGAARLRMMVGGWWEQQSAWTGQVAETLRVHHEVNNALVGVSGNAQLLLLGPLGTHPGARERLETVLREARRIELLMGRLRSLRAAIEPGPHALGERS